MTKATPILSEHLKFPQVKVLVFELPDGCGVEAEAIDAGAVGVGSSIQTAIEDLMESLQELYEVSLETRNPMTFSPRPEELALHQSMGPGEQPKLMPDGRTLVAAYTVWRPVRTSQPSTVEA